MQRFIKDIGNALFIGVLIYIIILVILYFLGRLDGGFSWSMAWTEFYGNMIPSWRFFENRYGDDFQSAKHLLTSLAGHFAISMAGIFVSRFIVFVLIKGWQTPIEFIINERIEEYYASLIIAVVVLAIFHAVHYYKNRLCEV